MKYSCTLEIALPRARVIALFDDPANLPKWQEGLQRFTPMSGTPGQTGATSEIVYQMRKRRVVMTETITKRALPDEFSGTYAMKGVWNSVQNHFTDLGSATRWDMAVEFRLGGFPQIMGWLLPGMFRRQTEKMMAAFKAFAEGAGQAK